MIQRRQVLFINIEERTRRKRRRNEKGKARKEKRKKRKVVDNDEYGSDDTVILDNEDIELDAKAAQDKEVQDDESLTLIRTDFIGGVELII